MYEDFILSSLTVLGDSISGSSDVISSPSYNDPPENKCTGVSAPGLCPLSPIHTSPLTDRKKGSSQPCCVSCPVLLSNAETSGQHRMLQTWLLRKRLTSHTASLSQTVSNSLFYSSWGKTESIHWLEKNKQTKERKRERLFLPALMKNCWVTCGCLTSGNNWLSWGQVVCTYKNHKDKRPALWFQSRHETSWHSVCGACVKPWLQSTALWSNACSNTMNR